MQEHEAAHRVKRPVQEAVKWLLNMSGKCSIARAVVRGGRPNHYIASEVREQTKAARRVNRKERNWLSSLALLLHVSREEMWRNG